MQSTSFYLLPDSNHWAILSLINKQMTSDQQTPENAIKAPLLLAAPCVSTICQNKSTQKCRKQRKSAVFICHLDPDSESK